MYADGRVLLRSRQGMDMIGSSPDIRSAAVAQLDRQQARQIFSELSSGHAIVRSRGWWKPQRPSLETCGKNVSQHEIFHAEIDQAVDELASYDQVMDRFRGQLGRQRGLAEHTEPEHQDQDMPKQKASATWLSRFRT